MIATLKDIKEKSVYLWCVPLNSFSKNCPEYMQYLSSEEMERAASFRFSRDRRRYEIAHGALRAILGSYLRKEPRSVQFRICESGKPELLAAPAEPLIAFNMSHSDDMMVLGVTKDMRIGVDVELINTRIDILQIAATHFTEPEDAEIRVAPADMRLLNFFSKWTCKEAYLKAVGCGLAGGLQSCPPTGKVSNWILRNGIIVQLRSFDQWTLLSLQLSNVYSAAVVVDGQPQEFILINADLTQNSIIRTAIPALSRSNFSGDLRTDKSYASSGGRA